jgi:carboxymethylenebutenolidase
MCDDEIECLLDEPKVSRRWFGMMSVAAAGLTATQTQAQAQVVEKDVEVKTAHGVADAALYHPPGKGSWPAVLVWTDIGGLRQAFRDMSRRLAAEGYVVLVPNPYYRSKRAPVMAAGDDRSVLQTMRALLTPEAVEKDAAAYIAFLDAQPQTNRRKKVGVQGYCMGGPLMMRTAATVANRVGAGASFHGGGLATKDPASPHLLAPKIKAQLLFAVAENDDARDPAAKETLREALAVARVPAKIEVYQGTNHGWCVRGSQAYNEPAAEKAWAELLALYKRALA